MDREKLIEDIIKNFYNKNDTKVIFVDHVQNHLDNMPEIKDKRVQCKICNKYIDEVIRERAEELADIMLKNLK